MKKYTLQLISKKYCWRLSPKLLTEFLEDKNIKPNYRYFLLSKTNGNIIGDYDWTTLITSKEDIDKLDIDFSKYIILKIVNQNNNCIKRVIITNTQCCSNSDFKHVCIVRNLNCDFECFSVYCKKCQNNNNYSKLSVGETWQVKY